ncbi:MAG TPA: hypothetical protein VK283_13570 [Acidimicrobiales bacterium]|nr:hypothetical protein [Acidimicrobiales bacterium]
MKALRFIPIVALVALSAATVTAPAGADGNHERGGMGYFHEHPGPPGRVTTCTGTLASPGTLAGTYWSNVTVNGVCFVDAGPASVRGSLTISPGSAVVAAFGLNDQTQSGNSSLSVAGDVVVQSGATLIMGCEPIFFTCLDDASAATGPGTLTSNGTVGGNVFGSHALAVVVHASSIGDNFILNGGGGGQTCATPTDSPSNTPSVELWATLAQSAPYSDAEDSTVRGNEIVANLATCWLGTARLQIGENLVMFNNQLADPDGIEILSNTISDNIGCWANSYVWDSSEANFGQTGLYPRTPQPNTVGGHRFGQCVLASPTTMGGPSGPGPF